MKSISTQRAHRPELLRVGAVVLALACAPWGLAAAPPGSARLAWEPALSLLYARIEEGQGYAIVYFRLANRGREPFTYTGYTAGGAMLTLQVKEYGAWYTQREVVCGTGLRTFVVPPEGEVEVARHVPPRLFGRRLRVGLADERDGVSRVWSDPFAIKGHLEP